MSPKLYPFVNNLLLLTGGKMEAFDMELLSRMIIKYINISKKGKSKIIDDYCRLTSVKRKTAIKRFNRYYVGKDKRAKRKIKPQGRNKKYNSVHKEIIKLCWELSGYICAEKLHPMIKVYINQLSLNSNLFRHYKPQDIEIAECVSLGSLKRIIRNYPKGYKKRRYKGNWQLYKQIPIQADFGKYAFEKPGYFEVDFVEHRNENSSGLFIVSICYTDVYSQWIARGACLGKDLQAVRFMDKIASEKIFYPIVKYHPDNDKSILNILLNKVKNTKNSINSVSISRSRPYKKEDNGHVEQKNYDKIRKLVGYYGYNNFIQQNLINRLYYYADMYDNFFIATSKLKHKIYHEGKIIKKIYEKPKTPYQRLIETKYISQEVKDKLTRIYKNLNMVELRMKMDKIIAELYESVGVSKKEKNSYKISKNCKIFGRHLFLSNKDEKNLVLET